MKYLKIADGVTLLNLVSGLLAVVCVIYDHPGYAAMAMFAAVIFDFADGFVVRLTGKPTTFGMYLDSFSDIISFGVVPVFIAFLIDGVSLFLFITSVFFLATGIYRLARFQVTKNENFEGMPITMNGLFVGVLLFLPYNIFSWYFILSGILMVSTLKVKKL